MVIEPETIRADTFKVLLDLFEANNPTYTAQSGSTATATIRAEYPRVKPVFPIVVIDPINLNTKIETMTGTSHLTYEIEVEVEFYALEGDGKQAIDAMRDSIQNTILTNVSDLDTEGLLLMGEPFDDSNTDSFTDGNQKVNTAATIIKFMLK